MSATIRITAKGLYCVLVDEPHPTALGTFLSFTDAASYCGYHGLSFTTGW